MRNAISIQNAIMEHVFKKISDILNDKNPPQKSGTTPTAESVFNFLNLVEAWESIVGSHLAQHTLPIKNVRKTLTIISDHPAYSQQLSFLQTQLIKKIIESFPGLQGHIKQIRFQTNSHFFQQKKATIEKNQRKTPRWHQFSPEIIRLKKEIQEHLKNIDDPELVRLLTSLYIQKKPKAPKEAL